jgi:hypothetical protein
MIEPLAEQVAKAAHRGAPTAAPWRSDMHNPRGIGSVQLSAIEQLLWSTGA